MPARADVALNLLHQVQRHWVPGYFRAQLFAGALSHAVRNGLLKAQRAARDMLALPEIRVVTPGEQDPSFLILDPKVNREKRYQPRHQQEEIKRQIARMRMPSLTINNADCLCKLHASPWYWAAGVELGYEVDSGP